METMKKGIVYIKLKNLSLGLMIAILFNLLFAVISQETQILTSVADHVLTIIFFAFGLAGYLFCKMKFEILKYKQKLYKS